tara:strand:- start:436 stop:624 length:189 start_codon:yes stop_codon:yes gene_type:complete
MQEYETIIENHYPIIWWIEDDNIIIQDRNNHQIDSDNIIYKREIEFIHSQIRELTFRGEICS